MYQVLLGIATLLALSAINRAQVCTNVQPDTTFETDPGDYEGPRGYPGYPNNADLCWTGSCATGETLQLTFSTICTDDGDGGDYLLVYDGASSSSLLLADLAACDFQPGPITTSGSDVYLNFISDANTVMDGFVASYTCIGGITCTSVSPGETFQSPPGEDGAGYPNNANLCWQGSCGQGKVVSLSFSDLCTEDGFDYIELYDSSSPDPSYWIATLSSCDPVSIMETSGPDLYMTFNTDPSDALRGFVATYTCVGCTVGEDHCAECTGVVCTGCETGYVLNDAGTCRVSDDMVSLLANIATLIDAYIASARALGSAAAEAILLINDSSPPGLRQKLQSIVKRTGNQVEKYLEKKQQLQEYAEALRV